MSTPRIVALGMMTKIPVAGVVWQTLHYLEGLARLGCDVRYVEAHARTPSMFMSTEGDDSSTLASAFLARMLEPIGMGDRWALWALHDDGSVHGTDRSTLDRWLREADAVVNLHGGTDPALVEAAHGRLLYVETDPVQLQIEIHDGVPETLEFLDAHEAFFTFGELWGRPGCRLPVTDRYAFHPTRQPVILDWWEPRPPATDAAITTVANWHQPWREVWLDGRRYGWSKDVAFDTVIDLPRSVATDTRFELALSGIDDAGRDRLSRHGWSTVDGLAVSGDVDRYRDYICTSLGEFTVAKEQNVALRSGWFSDRSATYLAAGRPVVTQSTGFEEVLPTGDGLLVFSTADEAADCVARVLGDPGKAGAAARTVAEEYFAHDRVLLPLLEVAGLRPVGRRLVGRMPAPDVELIPTSRRPLVLAPGVADRATSQPLPAVLPSRPPARPDLSVVVVTWNHLPLTRLCLDSLVGDPSMRGAELVIVDNGSTDATPEILRRLAEESTDPQVRVILNTENRGFARATNQGLEVALADRLVVLNNDTVCAPGTLRRLARHLDDPTIGVIGALAPHAGNEARIPVDYRRTAGYEALARRRAAERRGDVDDVAVVTLFCAATRRDVLDGVGLLDEDFGVGMFEDDDFAERVRRAGYRCALAQDVVVHHFGEGSFGDLFESGEHGRVFRENRDRFERKWHRSWTSHQRSVDSGYESMADRLVRLVEVATPPGSVVAVISQGDERLCEFEQRDGRHFPALADGRFAGHHPADDGEAAAHLDAAVARGARYLVIPQPSRWWLDHYRGLGERLHREFRPLADVDGTGVVFARQES